MTDIDIDDFIRKVQAYQGSVYALEDSYRQILNRLDIWGNLAEIDDSRTTCILEFLNRWKCRLSYDCISSLAGTLREASESLLKFKSYRLEEVSFDSLVDHLDDIKNVFRRIASVRAGAKTVGATATSKILHLVNPRLFMMSDRNIRHGYGYSDNEVGYARFMRHMKSFADALIREYSLMRNIPMNSVFPSLVSECKSRATTIPKLLDEYNWAKFNL